MFAQFTKDFMQLLFGGENSRRYSRDRVIARRAAARYSRGNVAIQLDAFVTREDLEKEREQVAKLKFRG